MNETESVALLEAQYELELYNLNNDHESELERILIKTFSEDSYLSIEDTYFKDPKSIIKLLETNYVLLIISINMSLYLLISLYILILKPTYEYRKFLKLVELKTEFKKIFQEEFLSLNNENTVEITSRKESASEPNSFIKEFDIDEQAELYGYFCAYLVIRHQCIVIPNGKMFLDWLEVKNSYDECLKEERNLQKLIYSY